jgi:hypothetical protein
MYQIEQFKQMNMLGKIAMTLHSKKRMQERNMLCMECGASKTDDAGNFNRGLQ